jgi:uncharacterized damage-inducible protein DinB
VNDDTMRQVVLELLRGGHAHITVDKALAGLPAKLRQARAGSAPHSIWEQLEHMRLAQEDILRFTLDRSWKSPEWPAGYWPSPDSAPTEAMWSKALAGFRTDLEAMCKLVEDRSVDLTARIPHGQGQSYLREALLVADHNAYHLGQIVQLRKLLGNAPSS